MKLWNTVPVRKVSQFLFHNTGRFLKALPKSSTLRGYKSVSQFLWLQKLNIGLSSNSRLYKAFQSQTMNIRNGKSLCNSEPSTDNVWSQAKNTAPVQFPNKAGRDCRWLSGYSGRDAQTRAQWDTTLCQHCFLTLPATSIQCVSWNFLQIFGYFTFILKDILPSW